MSKYRPRQWSKSEVAQVTALETYVSNMGNLVSAYKETRSGLRGITGETTLDAEAILDSIYYKISDEPLTFKCHHCTDLGYILRDDDEGIVWSVPCGNCEKGDDIISGIKVEEARERIRAAQREEERREEAQDVLREASGDKDEETLPW